MKNVISATACLIILSIIGMVRADCDWFRSGNGSRVWLAACAEESNVSGAVAYGLTAVEPQAYDAIRTRVGDTVTIKFVHGRNCAADIFYVHLTRDIRNPQNITANFASVADKALNPLVALE
ncbi:MAG: hypothetical protein GF398_17085 [Chitinivibrionales bacterium]|nr:hypothetical protein [Chitinivibrionales bacterium]